MVNTSVRTSQDKNTVSVLVGVYVAVAVATIAALAVLSRVQSDQAGKDAWVHGVLVVVFAALLPLRLRSARQGSAGAWRAVAIIAAVLCVANVVEASIPGLFPAWMRVEEVGIAALMVLVVVAVARRRR